VCGSDQQLCLTYGQAEYLALQVSNNRQRRCNKLSENSNPRFNSATIDTLLRIAASGDIIGSNGKVAEFLLLLLETGFDAISAQLTTRTQRPSTARATFCGISVGC